MSHAAYVFDAYGTLFDVHAAVRRHAGDVAARLADRIDAAEDDVVHLRRVEAVTVAQGAEHAGTQPHGRHLVKRAILLAPSARCAHGIIDVSFGHRG